MSYHYAIVSSGLSIHDAVQKRGHNSFPTLDTMWISLLIDIEDEPGNALYMDKESREFVLDRYPNEPHCVITLAENPKINNDWVSPIVMTAIYVWRTEE